mmetsp:Transcript_8329/g.15747  ORF Transcript_8329/g.15747 Transcript_8329/m.15747 type:complete len:148 (-) Transcript_8329:154-597(-)
MVREFHNLAFWLVDPLERRAFTLPNALTHSLDDNIAYTVSISAGMYASQAIARSLRKAALVTAYPFEGTFSIFTIRFSAAAIKSELGTTSSTKPSCNASLALGMAAEVSSSWATLRPATHAMTSHQYLRSPRRNSDSHATQWIDFEP